MILLLFLLFLLKRRISLRDPLIILIILIKKIIPDMQVVINNIIEHKIETHLLFGKYDSIITPQIGKDFANKSDLIHLHVLSCGHKMYNKETIDLLHKLI